MRSICNICRLITYFGKFVFGFLSLQLRDFLNFEFPSCPSCLAKCKQRLFNIFVTSSPKVTKNEKWDERNTRRQWQQQPVIWLPPNTNELTCLFLEFQNWCSCTCFCDYYFIKQQYITIYQDCHGRFLAGKTATVAARSRVYRHRCCHCLLFCKIKYIQ